MHLGEELAAAWRAHVRADIVVPQDPAEHERLLRQAFEEARMKWPKIRLRPGFFVTQLARKASMRHDQHTLEVVLSKFHLSDFFLACACLEQDPEAQVRFLALCHAAVKKALVGTGAENEFEDVCAQVFTQLVMGKDGKRPLLVEYAGVGPLRRWIGTIAKRLYNRNRVQPMTGIDDVDLIDKLSWVISSPNQRPADLALSRIEIMRVVQEVLREEFSRLEEEDRRLLRYRFKKQYQENKLAQMNQVSQPTISRWLQKVVDTLRTGTMRSLAERFEVTQHELSSILREISYPSLSQLFGSADGSVL